MNYNVTCTIVYNGKISVEADTFEEAMEKANAALNTANGTPSDIQFGPVDFKFGECTADYAELDSSSEEEMQQKIENILNDFDEYDERDICDKLAKLTGQSVYVQDSGIDDGADGDDTYVMYADIRIDNIGYVKIYYGNNTLQIGTFDVHI